MTSMVERLDEVMPRVKTRATTGSSLTPRRTKTSNDELFEALDLPFHQNIRDNFFKRSPQMP
jgi:hypothetical protein